MLSDKSPLTPGVPTTFKVSLAHMWERLASPQVHGKLPSKKKNNHRVTSI